MSCAAQGAYVHHSAAMLHSVLENAGGLRVHVHYLSGPDLAAGSRELLADMVSREGGSIDFLTIAPSRVAGLPADSRFTAAMWHRLFLPDLLADVDQVLYLDVDTLAVDSLEPLWRTDLADHYVAAVTNVFQHDHVHRPVALGLAGPEVYFNSGVLLMNLAAMRRDGCTKTLRDRARAGGSAFEWPDQDTLNVVLGERRVALHPRWNCMNSVHLFESAEEVFGRAVREEAIARPGIRHFEGPGANKPWHYMCDLPGRELYAAHRRRTPWPDFELEGASRRNAARRLVRDVRRRIAVSA